MVGADREYLLCIIMEFVKAIKFGACMAMEIINLVLHPFPKPCNNYQNLQPCKKKAI